MILAIKTDQPQAYIALAYGEKTHELQWLAGRRLSIELLPEIEKLLHKHNVDWRDLKGVIVFEGPGSFTGLRIGIATANTIAYSLSIPVAGGQGEDWLKNAIDNLKEKEPGDIVVPHYGAEANITRPKE